MLCMGSINLMRSPLATWLPRSGLILGLIGVVCACSLNPQPLPPDTADAGSKNPGLPDAGQTAVYGDASGLLETGAASDALESGIAEADEGAPSVDASDAEPDARPDAQPEAASDAEPDATIDGDRDATLDAAPDATPAADTRAE